MSPFWSPDSRFVGFFARDRRAQEESRSPADRPEPFAPRRNCKACPTWGRDGTILFTQLRRGHLSRARPRAARPRASRRRQGAARAEPLLAVTSFPTAGTSSTWRRRSTPRDNASRPAFTWHLSIPRSESRWRRCTPRSGLCAPGYLLFVEDGALLAQTFECHDVSSSAGEPVEDCRRGRLLQNNWSCWLLGLGQRRSSPISGAGDDFQAGLVTIEHGKSTDTGLGGARATARCGFSP